MATTSRGLADNPKIRDMIQTRDTDDIINYRIREIFRRRKERIQKELNGDGYDQEDEKENGHKGARRRLDKVLFANVVVYQRLKKTGHN